ANSAAPNEHSASELCVPHAQDISDTSITETIALRPSPPGHFCFHGIFVAATGLALERAMCCRASAWEIHRSCG
ncbi:hypothetical protein, partial [Klebsiella pneumoniae]|uniref:hypothetical protein n=1 Tax=Klebsiella pneumoniae TaxID=573 RepID=UPI00300A52B4